MDKQKLHGLLILIIPRVIEQISVQTNTTELESTLLFYNSHTYKLLEDAETGLWNYSAITLCNMFLSEQKTGSIVFPEGA